MLRTLFSFSRMGLFTLVVGLGGLLISVVQASEESGGAAAGGHGEFAMTFLWIAVLLLVAKLASLIERFGQPSVLGELVIGVLLGNLVLLGIDVFEPVKHDTIINFFAQLGVVILLFQIGLESNIKDMRRVGVPALLVAILGVVVPFLLGTYFIGPLLLPGLSGNAYIFLGAALTATSVGITARVFQELGKLQTKEARTILGAAVIDDVLGLTILAVVSALVTAGSVSVNDVGLIVGKAVLFLVGAIVIGQITAPYLGKFWSKVHTGAGMKFTLAISLALLSAFVATKLGLAPIVGAFAAGLVLDPVHFRFFRNQEMAEEVKEASENASGDLKKQLRGVLSKHSDKHVEELVEPLAFFFVPIFFIVTGMAVDLSTLADPKVVLTALGITVVALLGKLIAGLGAGRGVDKLIVGFGMVPRGEVGLIFATIGKGLGVINDEVFSIIIIMVILTTLLTPPILSLLLKRQEKKQQAA